jgi:hypothetical protein
MFQIVEALTGTVTRHAEQHGSKVALAVLVLVGCGAALRLLYRAVSGGSSGGA